MTPPAVVVHCQAHRGDWCGDCSACEAARKAVIDRDGEWTISREGLADGLGYVRRFGHASSQKALKEARAS